MSSAGHVLDAIKRLENNRNLLKMHRARFSELKKAVSKTEAKYHVFKDRNTLTESELNQYKEKVRNKIINDRRKNIIFSLLLTLSVLIIIFIVFYKIYNFLGTV
jgi:hypothetical protein